MKFVIRNSKWAFLLSVFISSSLWAATPQEYYQSGIKFYGQGQYDQAVTMFQEAVNENPQFWQAYQALGQAYYQEGKKNEALNAMNKSLSINPNNPQLREFVEKNNTIISNGAQTSSPTLGVKTKSPNDFDPEKRKDHIFFKIYAGPNYSLLGDVRDSIDNLNKQYSQGGVVREVAIGIMGGYEAGYMLDKESAIGVNLEGYSQNDMEYQNAIYSGTTMTYEFDQSFEDSGFGIGLKYYRFFPDPSGQWYLSGCLSYYNLNVTFRQGLLNTSAGVSQFIDAGVPGLSGDAIGGTLGFGREFILFGAVSFSISADLKYLNFDKVTGPYTANGNPSIYIPSTRGQGSLVVLPGNVIGLVDNSVYKTSMGRYASYDLSGADLRLDINIWL